MAERPFGPYRLVRQVAVGGMAEIHLAKTRGIAGFEKYVALKMIHPNFSQDEQFIQMLIDEAKITVQLQHVNIAQTFDLGRVGNVYYITMEYVDGADLYKVLRRASEHDLEMPFEVCAFVAKEMANGLDYAHQKRDLSGRELGIVHRDVSPQNVLLSYAGEVKLVDFGIAKATMRARQTAVGVIKGKYYYMSPEQSWGEKVDHRSDIFSTGIVLYEMLTGQMLYLEEDLHKLLEIVRRAAIALPSTLRKGVPPQLERIVMRALARHPSDRYQTASDLATDLERFMHVYAPVFTAAKVVQFTRKALGEPEAVEPAPLPPLPRLAAPRPAPAPLAASPPAAAKPVRRDPHRPTQPIEPQQLVRERDEIADENSVIFRLDELKQRKQEQQRQRADAVPARVAAAAADYPSAAVTAPEGGPRGLVRPLGGHELEPEPTMAIGDDELIGAELPAIEPEPRSGVGRARSGRGSQIDSEARTVIAPSPGAAEGESEADYEPTFIDAVPGAVSANGNGNGNGNEGDEGEVDLDAPTNTDFSATRPHRGQHDEAVSPSPGLRLRSDGRLPAHPALAARSPGAAVSAVRPPRQSRRTPAGGAPAAGGQPVGAATGGGQPASVLSSIVSSAHTEPLPTRPVRGTGTLSDGIPRGMLADPSSMAGEPIGPDTASTASPLHPIGTNIATVQFLASGVPAGPLPQQHAVPMAAGAVLTGMTPPGAFAAAQPAASTAPPWPNAWPQGGLPLAPPLQTPYPLPGGVAHPTFTQQVAALQVDEIPAAYKIGRDRPRWLIRVALALLLVIAGIGVGAWWLGDRAPRVITAALVIDSIPQGASVTIDGTALPEPTPTRFEGRPGQRYAIAMSLAKYQPWRKELQARTDGGEISVLGYLTALPVRLRVTTTPLGAAVFINGQLQGRTPFDRSDLDAEATRTLRVDLPGYVSESRELDWSQGTDVSLDIPLRR